MLRIIPLSQKRGQESLSHSGWPNDGSTSLTEWFPISRNSRWQWWTHTQLSYIMLAFWKESDLIPHYSQSGVNTGLENIVVIQILLFWQVHYIITHLEFSIYTFQLSYIKDTYHILSVANPIAKGMHFSIFFCTEF